MEKVDASAQQLTSSACSICFIVASKLAGMPTASAISCLCASGCSPFHDISAVLFASNSSMADDAGQQ